MTLAGAVLWAACAARAAGGGVWDGLPEDRLSLHHRAVAHWGLAMYETAAREFEEILSARPDFPPALLNLAAIRVSQRRYEDALRILKAAPAGPRGRYLRGLCLAGLDRRPEALEQLRRAAALAPEEPAVHFKLAEVLAADGQAAPAQEELRRVLALRPDHGAALDRLARLLRLSGDEDEARRLLRRFASLEKGRARRAERCPWDEPEEPPPGAAPPAGGRWIEVSAAEGSVVTLQAGRLALRAKSRRGWPIRFELGDKRGADAVRVDWPDGEHSYKLGIDAGQAVVIEEVSAHVW